MVQEAGGEHHPDLLRELSGVCVVPGRGGTVQPGMKGEFLKEITELGHGAGMKVMGVFLHRRQCVLVREASGTRCIRFRTRLPSR